MEILASAVVVSLGIIIANKRTNKRIDEMGNKLMASNVALGYDLDKIVTVEHIEGLKKDIKKQVSSVKTKKRKTKRRRK